MMTAEQRAANRPTGRQTWETLVWLGELFGTDQCWLHDGAFHFKVPGDDELTISLTPESAQRFKVQSCRLTVPCATVWASVDDRARLAAVILDLNAEARLALPV